MTTWVSFGRLNMNVLFLDKMDDLPRCRPFGVGDQLLQLLQLLVPPWRLSTRRRLALLVRSRSYRLNGLRLVVSDLGTVARVNHIRGLGQHGFQVRSWAVPVEAHEGVVPSRGT